MTQETKDLMRSIHELLLRVAQLPEDAIGHDLLSDVDIMIDKVGLWRCRVWTDFSE